MCYVLEACPHRLETETAASTECWFGESEFNCKKKTYCVFYICLSFRSLCRNLPLTSIFPLLMTVMNKHLHLCGI